MRYLITLLEGFTTFISPCMLPMIPVYVSFFSGGKENNTRGIFKNALGFVGGFTTIFVLLGAFAGTIGSFFQNYQRIINIFAGILIIIFGLKFMGLLKINIFRGIHQKMDNRNYGFFPSVLMGIIFSLSWTPCVGAFVGSALVYASQQGNPLVGVGMLASYSAGLGIPFLLSAVLIDKFKGKFEKIKHHHYTLHIICGAFLVIVGILMITGKLGGFLELFD